MAYLIIMLYKALTIMYATTAFLLKDLFKKIDYLLYTS